MECKNCGNDISSNKRFCNRSCAASFNNKNRKLDQQTKQKISSSLKKQLPIEQVIQKYQSGETIKSIANTYKCFSTTISKLLKEHGVLKSKLSDVCPIHNVSTILNNQNRVYCPICNTERVKKRKKELKIKSIEYLGGKCSQCSYDKCVSALEFHHLDPNEKDFGISEGNTRSWEKIKKELDKCILVCANCHREIHERERK